MFKNYGKDFLKKKSGSSETVFMVGDLNINSFYYDNNALVKKIFNLIFQRGFVTLIQGATFCCDCNWPHHKRCNTWKYHALRNHKSKHIWSFPYICYYNSCHKNKKYEKTKLTKRDFSNESIQNFQFLLENIKWDQLLPSNAPHDADNIF